MHLLYPLAGLFIGPAKGQAAAAARENLHPPPFNKRKFLGVMGLSNLGLEIPSEDIDVDVLVDVAAQLVLLIHLARKDK